MNRLKGGLLLLGPRMREDDATVTRNLCHY